MVSVTKEKMWGHTPPQFFIGLVLAAVGAGLVMAYKPSGSHAPGPDKKTGALSTPARPATTPTARPQRQPVQVAEGFADVTTRRYFVS
jgi:hypothetical protein